MPQLAATCSNFLLNLLREKKRIIDGVELTPWQVNSSLPGTLSTVAGYPLYFHGSNLAAQTMLIPDARSRLSKTLSQTGSQWFSTHISLLPPGWRWLSVKFNIQLPYPPVEQLLSRFIRSVERLKKYHPIPLLLENMPLDPGNYDKKLKSPEVIREVIERTSCGLLLDLPHARIVAEAFGLETTEFIRQLPMDRIVEIHTSGPERRQDGCLIDRHAIMQEADYQLLEWVLANTPAQLVTLEYFKDEDNLQNQLSELSSIIKTVVE